MGKYMIIDGNRVEFDKEKNILDVVRKAGVDLPTLCYYSELSIYGACRMCVVEDDKGRIITSCSTPPKDKMTIKTNTPQLHKHRKMILELILASHRRDCTVCRKNGRCRLQELAIRYGVKKIRFKNSKNKAQIDRSSKSIFIDSSKCILCGDCVRMCNEVQNVGAIDFAFRGSKMTVSPAFGRCIADTNCVGCGQCAAVCPTGAVIIKSCVDEVWDAIYNPKKRVVMQISPAVRVALGEEFGIKYGENVMDKIVEVMRRLGVDEIYDTSLGADLTTLEESKEFLEKLKAEGKISEQDADNNDLEDADNTDSEKEHEKDSVDNADVDKEQGKGSTDNADSEKEEGNNSKDNVTGSENINEEQKENNKRIRYPLFTSCCPAWFRYAETKHPELLPSISTCKSPMEMFGVVIKEYFKKKDIDEGRTTVSIAVMPCTAKKAEADRPEFIRGEVKDIDYVLTTSELCDMINESGIKFEEIEGECSDTPFSLYSGAGVIFGVTGGVTEAVVRTISEDKSPKALKELQFIGIRGMEGVKVCETEINGLGLRIGIVNGLANAERLIKVIESGEEHFDFVEVMACKGGCIGGAGQPFGLSDIKCERAKGLYKVDKVAQIKISSDNPRLNIIYNEVLKGNSHLLHR
ncbi:[Fe-Fe] hydrogenase large subunit C-terminal domain-containing protein [uncultured Clostridium sp.]|uniref:[Fe-Fe] hydrogenase large subunit C-terminal domain-containing protein n=1 Tax=uncultured Clostridium sp. TaxID=59620 RepID=UPI0025E92D43|nr:[Fe-Fe] hydrogenase large subunit C-terminal domain-containing protein [uncultured Clostridium sp.]